MAGEQVTVSETITKAVAEATRVAIQTMAVTTAESPQTGRTQDRQTCYEAANIHLGGAEQVQQAQNLQVRGK